MKYDAYSDSYRATKLYGGHFSARDNGTGSALVACYEWLALNRGEHMSIERTTGGPNGSVIVEDVECPDWATLENYLPPGWWHPKN